MRNNIEVVEVFRDRPLTISGITNFSSDIPVGEGITRAMLTFNLNVTAGTAAGAIADGELSIVRGITLRTNNNEFLYRNVPLRGLWALNTFKERTTNIREAIAAASGIYRVNVNLWFVDNELIRPYDTILDTSQIANLELSVSLGSIADLFTTPGTGSVTATMDMSFERVGGILPEEARPLFYQEIGGIVPVNPLSSTIMDLERAGDLIYKRLLIGTHNSAVLGQPFSGNPVNNVIRELSIETDRDIPVRSNLGRAIQARNKVDYLLPAIVPGKYLIDWVFADGSLRSGLFSGQYARLRASWVNDVLSSSQISGIYESVREFREIRS